MIQLPSAACISQMTPMMQQYFTLKTQCPDAILFFRMGDFYEVFGDEAKLVAPLLDIALTSRERGDKNRISFCGVPHHSAQNYWLKLLAQDFRIAIADQTEDAAESKGLVKREIIKILSPGCIDEPEGLREHHPNYLMAAYEDPQEKRWVITVSDVSTGEFRLSSCLNIDQVLEQAYIFEPKELLIRRFARPLFVKALQKNPLVKILLTELAEASLIRSSNKNALLTEIFGTLAAFCQKIPSSPLLVQAVLTHYQTLKMNLSQFYRIDPFSEAKTMSLQETVLRDLEVFVTARERSVKGSLFGEINRTLTPMGIRKLRQLLMHPYCQKEAIEKKQFLTEKLLLAGKEKIAQLRASLEAVSDLERLRARLLSARAKPQELLKLKRSLTAAKLLFTQLSELQWPLASSLLEQEDSWQALSLLNKALQTELGLLGSGSDVLQKGYDSVLDQKLDLLENGTSKVADYLEKLRQETKIQSLKIKHHKTFGLILEVTKSNLARIPENFIRRQTMVNCERFVTEELKALDEELSSAKELAIAREDELYQQLLSHLASFEKFYLKLSETLSEVDLIQSYAWLSLSDNYCRPQFSSAQNIKLKACRHPVVERFTGAQKFVANNLLISKEQKQVLITGPNMAGKSTLMRQVAICAILAQIGSHVPCESAELPIFDQVFTRVGAADDLSRGLSTFMVEMTETAYILRNATENSLVLLDEVGRGTSTQDGLAIASSVLEDLSTRIGCYTFFATHYHELVPFAKKLPTVQTMQTKVLHREGQIVFTHLLIPGASASSFGVEVAKLAGIPIRVVEQAKSYLASFPQNSEKNISSSRKQERKKTLTCLFPEETLQTSTLKKENLLAGELSKQLKKIAIDHTTPLQALKILSDFKKKSENFHQKEIFPDRQV